MVRRVLVDALAARHGGNAYAAVHLARQLARSPKVDSVVVAAREGSIAQRGLRDEQSVACITPGEARRFELIRRLGWEAAQLPRVVHRERIDVVISMSGMLPRRLDSDVICLVFNPVMYERDTPPNLLRRYAVRRTARNAKYVAAPSRMMAHLAASSIGRQCAVVPLGVDHQVFTPTETIGREILCVADFYAHKRHDLVLDMWLGLQEPRPPLRLIGDPAVDVRAYSRLMARVKKLPGADAIHIGHRLPLGQLVDAYHRARVFILASTRESFCMPLVESMSCGVPAVVRDLPSLRETGGSGATYVDGDDPATWAAAVERNLNDDADYVRARDSALESSRRFSWESFTSELEQHI